MRANGAAAAQVDVQLEALAPAVEVLVELALGARDRRMGAKDAWAERARERVELLLGVWAKPDAAEATLGGGDEQRADRRVDDVEAHVEQAFRGGGLAEAAVELGRDGHGVPPTESSVWARRRRIPDDAAWRAASGLEPSAVAMSS